MEMFKAKTMAKLVNLERELKEKYADRQERIDYIVSLLMAKLSTLQPFGLPDFIFTIYLASKEFPEFKELMPSLEEMEELMKLSM